MKNNCRLIRIHLKVYMSTFFIKKYLLKKYIAYSLIVSLLILFTSYFLGFTDSIIGLIFKSFFIGGTIGVILTYKYFSSFNYWVLYSNLRINKYLHLGICYLSYQFCLLIIVFMIGVNIDGI